MPWIIPCVVLHSMQKENLQRKDHRAKKNKANRRKEAILTITKRKNKKEKRKRKDYETTGLWKATTHLMCSVTEFRVL